MWSHGVCWSGMGTSSTYWSGCKHLGAQSAVEFVTHQNVDCCHGLVRVIEGHPCDFITLREQTLEVVDKFCYLGGIICTEGGCKHGTIAIHRFAWGKIRELLPLLINRYITSTSKLVEKYSVYVYDLSCCMVVSAGHWKKGDEVQIQRYYWVNVKMDLQCEAFWYKFGNSTNYNNTEIKTLKVVWAC